jgi:hypothetical protein
MPAVVVHGLQGTFGCLCGSPEDCGMFLSADIDGFALLCSLREDCGMLLRPDSGALSLLCSLPEVLLSAAVGLLLGLGGCRRE